MKTDYALECARHQKGVSFASDTYCIGVSYLRKRAVLNKIFFTEALHGFRSYPVSIGARVYSHSYWCSYIGPFNGLMHDDLNIFQGVFDYGERP